MSELRLRVGGRYQTRSKGPAVVADKGGMGKWVFEAVMENDRDEEFTCTPEGRAGHDISKDSPYDLISEITPERENKMETFFALITKVHDNGRAAGCVGRIFEMKVVSDEWSNLPMLNSENRDHRCSWRWNQKDFGHFERLPTLTRAAFNAHWGIKDEPVKPKDLPAAVQSALEKGDFGCRRDSVKDLSQALIQHFESRLEEVKGK